MEQRSEEKRRRLEEALVHGVAMIHLDARRPGVMVPKQFTTDFHLRLNLSMRFEPPDLTTSEWGVRETLSFNGQRFCISVPWSAIFAITGAASEKHAWLFPEDMPRELFEAAARHFGLTGEEVASLREEATGQPLRSVAVEAKTGFKPRVVEGGEPPVEPDEPDKGPRRGHLRLVK